ncbi:thrombospondin type-1 domain-containing protein 1 isoform X2 [Electrophorus electricus]|uniref:thrombospondin type-1 domain-containing protein 1 isoform X2 n=1 Tax=Electrophorus electricus TaxID=8005 RepID=UPI0015D071FD|nr:thrombospondin type-1 domain-containing protein 1 isoform X2 [Electrophorus electricus]
MTQGFTPIFPFLLLLVGFSIAGLHVWPSVHIALSNASVFVDYQTNSNMTDSEQTMALVDVDRNETMLTKSLPFNQSQGSLEFDCTCFLYAGNFSFRLDQTDHKGMSNIATNWWSPVLRVQWPTFHLGVERAGPNRSSDGFQIAISTNDHFHACPDSKGSSLYLEVNYLEHNQIGKNAVNKVRSQQWRDIEVARSQHVGLDCASPLTDRGFVQLALRSRHTNQDIKSSGPLYLSRIFSYKLLVKNAYKDRCESTVVVRLLPPPCSVATGKVLLYKEARAATEQALPVEMAFHFLGQGENETEFNCSIFDLGRNKYCFHFALDRQSPSSAHACVIVQRNADMWGPWQTWSGCSVTCGEGVRERMRECLLPSGGGMQCTGLVREQSLCSLEDCTGGVLVPSSPSPPPLGSPLGENLVVVAGISLCLVVILVTILITVWRKLCHTPKRSSVRRESMHPPSGRKNSDEASICRHSLQRPSFSESVQAVVLQKGLTLPAPVGPASDKGVLARQQSVCLPTSLSQDPERMSPSGQKIMPPIFGYRLAQQQLKEMKKKGLKEATKVYHVSQSPVDDIMLEATASTSAGLTPVPQELERPEEPNDHFHKSHLPEPICSHKNFTTPLDRLSPKGEPMTWKASFSRREERQERTAQWVATVERNRLGSPKNPNFRRTCSFNESNLQQAPPPRPFRERSLTQVVPRQIPEGSCRARTWEQAIPEQEDSSRTKSRTPESLNDQRWRPWVGTSPGKSKPALVYSGTSSLTKNPLGGRRALGQAPTFGSDQAERVEQSRSRRGPSPIQRNILARKMREANASGSNQRQRSATFSICEPHGGRCRSLPLSADYSSSYGLTEAEHCMMDISAYLGEEVRQEVGKGHRLT